MWDRLAGDWGSLCGTDWLVTEEACVGQTSSATAAAGEGLKGHGTSVLSNTPPPTMGSWDS